VPLTAPRCASRRSTTAELVAAILPHWRGELTTLRLARTLRRPVAEVFRAFVAAREAGRLELRQREDGSQVWAAVQG